MSLDGCRLIELPKIEDARGSLIFLEAMRHVPFEIKRVFYICDVPDGAARGSHAHKVGQQVLIAVSGSFDVTLDDGWSRRAFHLDRAHSGLYVPAMIWGEIDNFSSGAVCMALTSELYSEGDYLRTYGEFLEAVKALSPG